MAVKKLKKVKSLRELRQLANNDAKYQELAVSAAQNIGALDSDSKDWNSAIRYLEMHMMSLVGEYGMDEDEAEKSIVDEVNFVR